MTTVDCAPEKAGLPGGSLAISLLANGSPLARTLEAVASVAAGIDGVEGCGILLANDDRFSAAATYGLRTQYLELLGSCSEESMGDCLARLSKSSLVEVRTLVTASAELVGVIVVFTAEGTRSRATFAGQLDEVCAIATLAIESKNLVDELYFRVHHDPLTQIWNRLRMQEEVARVLDDSLQTGYSTGLALMGIDSFRVVNELLGSEIGNDLLKEVARRLTRVIRPTWSLARCSGDEFVVLLPELASAEQGKVYAAELMHIFDQPFALGDHDLIVRASIGISISTSGEYRPDDLQNQAEIALRYGKRHARGRVSSFDKSMVSTPPERLEMERHLRFALRKREFELFYQPQIELASGKLIGVEALLRWRHPSTGFISPAIFIPIAEQIGIIDEIGAWVLQEAVEQLGRWQKAGLKDLRVAVNVSAIQFSREDFASSVAKCLRTAWIKPSDLELEITESVVMTNFEHGLRQIKLLRSLGIPMALDDFGTGHSSLAYLQQLPIQRIKIDRMFVKDVTSETDSHPLLSSIIGMARAVGCAVIAEGIETAEQALALSELGCDEVQGFFFARPMPAAELFVWAKNR